MEISDNNHSWRLAQMSYRDGQDLAIFHEIFMDKVYWFLEPDLKNVNTWLVIDVWAHIGLFSLFINSINPNVEIYCHEADKWNFDFLQRNISDHSTAFNLAVSWVDWEVDLHLSNKPQNHSLYWLYFDSWEKVSVQSKSLNNIFTENQIENCELLKLDCEWAEFEIPRSCKKGVFSKIQRILVEYHEFSENKKAEIIKILEENWFEIELMKASDFNKNIGLIYAKRKAW